LLEASEPEMKLALLLAILLLLVLVYYRGGEVPPTVAELRQDRALLDATFSDCMRRMDGFLLEKIYPSERCTNAMEAMARQSQLD
jgi:hypothetical protein